MVHTSLPDAPASRKNAIIGKASEINWKRLLGSFVIELISFSRRLDKLDTDMIHYKRFSKAIYLFWYRKSHKLRAMTIDSLAQVCWISLFTGEQLMSGRAALVCHTSELLHFAKIPKTMRP